jgi:hypothetical protein
LQCTVMSSWHGFSCFDKKKRKEGKHVMLRVSVTARRRLGLPAASRSSPPPPLPLSIGHTEHSAGK